MMNSNETRFQIFQAKKQYYVAQQAAKATLDKQLVAIQKRCNHVLSDYENASMVNQMILPDKHKLKRCDICGWIVVIPKLYVVEDNEV